MTGVDRLSAKFVHGGRQRHPHACAGAIAGAPPESRRSGHGGEKHGEWLVDACVTAARRESADFPFIDRVVFALESESDPGQQASDRDFAKLVHLNAECKLYLNGLRQTTPRGMCEHMRRRRRCVEAILNRAERLGESIWASGRRRPNRETAACRSTRSGAGCKTGSGPISTGSASGGAPGRCDRQGVERERRGACPERGSGGGWSHPGNRIPTVNDLSAIGHARQGSDGPDAAASVPDDRLPWSQKSAARQVGTQPRESDLACAMRPRTFHGKLCILPVVRRCCRRRRGKPGPETKRRTEQCR